MHLRLLLAPALLFCSACGLTTVPVGPDADPDRVPAGGCPTLGETVDTDLTIPRNCRITIDDPVFVLNGALLTIESGVVIEFGSEGLLSIGPRASQWCTSNKYDDCAGSLRIEGTATDPVLFTSSASSPSPGAWGSLIFDENVVGTTVDHLIVEFGGKDRKGGAFFREADEIGSRAVTIRDSVFRDNLGGGLYVEGREIADILQFERNTLERNGDYSVNVTANMPGAFDGSNLFDAPLLVRFDKMTTDATWIDHGQPYVLEGRAVIEAEWTLFGEVQMAEDDFIQVRGALRATGATFGSEKGRAGDWDGIVFSSLAGASRIESSHVRHAGSDGDVISFSADSFDAEPLARRTEIVSTVFEDNGGNVNIAVSAGRGDVVCDQYTGTNAANVFDLLPCE